jgi:hypothetical protein
MMQAKKSLSAILGALCAQLRNLWIWEHGGETLESGLVTAAVIGPLLLGLISAGRAYNTYGTMKQAARAGTRVALVRSCATCGNALPAVSDVENAVLNSLQAASLSASQITIPSCPGNLSTKICYQQNIQLNPGDGLIENGAIVSFTYPVSLVVPFTPVNLASIKVTTQVQMREEN